MTQVLNTGDSAARDWQHINRLANAGGYNEFERGQIRYGLEGLRKGMDSPTLMHPFKVYQYPSYLRAAPDAEVTVKLALPFDIRQSLHPGPEVVPFVGTDTYIYHMGDQTRQAAVTGGGTYVQRITPAFLATDVILGRFTRTGLAVRGVSVRWQLVETGREFAWDFVNTAT